MELIEIIKEELINEDLEISKKLHFKEGNSQEDWDLYEVMIRNNSHQKTLEEFIDFSPIFDNYSYDNAITRVSRLIEKINVYKYCLI